MMSSRRGFAALTNIRHAAGAGFYNLNLTLPADREVALRLRGLKIDQETLENRLAQYHAGPPRKGGKRDAIQRVWRNAVHVTSSSNAFVFSHDWNVSVVIVLRVSTQYFGLHMLLLTMASPPRAGPQDRQTHARLCRDHKASVIWKASELAPNECTAETDRAHQGPAVAA